MGRKKERWACNKDKKKEREKERKENMKKEGITKGRKGMK